MTEPNWTAWLRDGGFAPLFDIKENEPGEFDEIPWSPEEADSKAAWELYTELRTRIATQPLAYRAGDEGAALDSVYQLFQLSRNIIKVNSHCTHFAALTIRILNKYVRPFTAKWHRVKTEGLLSSADVRYEFRLELSDLQSKLRTFTHLLGLLAKDARQIAESEAQLTQIERKSVPGLWDPLPFGIAEGIPGTDTFRDKLNGAEIEDIKERRASYGLVGAQDGVGLALSGGGIRSATFALGVIQQLARKGILRQVDYLSTVSGGGYLGSFISSFLNSDDSQVSLEPEDDKLPFGSDKDPESKAVRQLRNHGKYLTEGGISTLATIVVLIIYGVFTSVLLIAPFVLTSVLIAVFAFEEAFKYGTFLPLSQFTLMVLALLSVSILLLPWRGRSRGLQSKWGQFCILLAVTSVLFVLAESLPKLLSLTRYIGGPSVLFWSIVALPILLGVIGLWLGVTSRAGRIVLGLFTVAGPLLMLAAFLWLVDFFISDPSTTKALILFGLTVFLWFYSSFALNINHASPHSFYRERLAKTYLIRLGEGNSIRSLDPQKLSEMNDNHMAPYHLINCAVNIPASTDPDLRGRNTDFFLFSKYFCGGPMAGFDETPEWEKMDPNLDLGTAMAISGAAAAPHMGTLTSRRYTFLLALLNVRLGYWLRKPGSLRNNKWRPRLAWYYFFLELLGGMSEKNIDLNLSDGGHIENLGIYELLRRRCKFVIAIDGEADPNRSFGGLIKLTQLAKIDLGVTIEPDLTDLQTDLQGFGRSHFALFQIKYAESQYGFLLYIKSSLTGNEPQFLKKYRLENPAFPHQSTAQQLFSETQFEAYRALGEHIAHDLFRRDLVDEWTGTLTVRNWFEQLSRRLFE
ncbi:MAG TPA: patatin-like phospholipase family protein [Pyrinomonadaceae bacterium]